MSDGQVILAIETSVKKGSLSLLVGGEERAFWIGDTIGSRSEDLLFNVKNLLDVGGIKLSQLDLVAVSLGPGSFTGLRVGIAIGKGIAFSLGIRCVGVSVLEAMAVAWQNNFSVGEIIVLVSLVGKFACWQGFNLDNGLLKNNTEMIFDKLESINFGMEKEERISLVVESETYQRLLNNSGISHKFKITKTTENLAKFVGIIALNQFNSLVNNEVLPKYFI